MSRVMVLMLVVAAGCGTSEASHEQRCSRLSRVVAQKGRSGGFTFAEHAPALRRAGAGCDGVARALDLHDKGAPLIIVARDMATALRECRCQVADLDELERHLQAGLE